VVLAGAGLAPVIVTGADGYLVEVPADLVDLGRFQYWLGEADAAASYSDLDRESSALARPTHPSSAPPLRDVYTHADTLIATRSLETTTTATPKRSATGQ
jgi:hypothetical protein